MRIIPLPAGVHVDDGAVVLVDGQGFPVANVVRGPYALEHGKQLAKAVNLYQRMVTLIREAVPVLYGSALGLAVVAEGILEEADR